MQDMEPLDGANQMKITGLSPYWLDVAQGSAVHNAVDMKSLFLLTGPNGGGKSSLLRSICAAALLGICGFMVPAESALIPHFDAVMLHMKSYDSPADGKSSFQVQLIFLDFYVTNELSMIVILVDMIDVILLAPTQTCRDDCMHTHSCI